MHILISIDYKTMSIVFLIKLDYKTMHILISIDYKTMSIAFIN